MALIEDRSVTASVIIGTIRRLLRSTGMGGTASPLGWCMAYDPIVEGMFRALGIEAPTYVDDLAGLLSGPVQAIQASFYSIWASRAAGLEVSIHICRRFTYPQDSQRLRSACASLPVTTWLSEDGRRHVTGLPPVLLRSLMGQLWPEGGYNA